MSVWRCLQTRYTIVNMKTYIENILPRISKFSEQLNKLTLLLDEPWVIVNGDGGFVKLIFKKDNSILVSKNGEVSIGKWELLNKANSLLIQIESSTKLYNHCFLDKAVMILKMDGGNEYMTLLNQNIIPDLNVNKYFEEKLESINPPRIVHPPKDEIVDNQDVSYWGWFVAIAFISIVIIMGVMLK